MSGQVSEPYKNSVDEDDIYKRLGVCHNTFLRLKQLILDLTAASEAQVRDDCRIGINLAVLTNALYSYYYDIKRIKDFHGSDLVNKPKMAAYLIKWLVKEKPIWFINEEISNPETMEILSCINELFAFRIGLGFACIPLAIVDIGTSDKFVYELAFRNPEPSMISFWLETFVKHHNLAIE